jgi:hypothetical protein
MLTPTTTYIVHTQASSIMSENLLKDDRINVDFNVGILSFNFNIVKERDRVIQEIGDNPKTSFEVYCQKNKQNLLRAIASSQSNSIGFIEESIKTIKTEIVLVTTWTIYNLPYVKYLLDYGKRVAIGGSFCNAYTTERIRSILKNMGSTEQQLKNLIIVRGYIGSKTDIYKIIKDWKDLDIPNYDFLDRWDSTEDYMKKYLKLVDKARGVTQTYYSVTFDNNCWYNKCKFCKIRNEVQPDFIKEMDAQQVYENVAQNMREYGSTNIVLYDFYFLFTEKNKEIFSKLRKDGFKIFVLSGIIKLKDREYLENINRFVDGMSIGLESTTDFSLKYINKGYGWADIQKSIDQIRKYLDRDKGIRYLTIVDLVMKDKEEILEKYANIVEMGDRLGEYGFTEVGFSSTSLQMFPDVAIVQDTDNLKILKDNNEDTSSGLWYIYNYLDKHFNIKNDVVTEMMMPFERYDNDRNLLKSDFEYIDVELVKRIRV